VVIQRPDITDKDLAKRSMTEYAVMQRAVNQQSGQIPANGSGWITRRRLDGSGAYGQVREGEHYVFDSAAEICSW
jgi:hypothetical protein